jgi:hypothetical protein
MAQQNYTLGDISVKQHMQAFGAFFPVLSSGF